MTRKFEIVGNVDVSLAAMELRSSPYWNAFTGRQDFQDSPHRNTKCIPLRASDSFLTSYEVKSKRSKTRWAHFLPHTVALVNKVLAGLPVATVGNVLAVALQPGGWVRPHIDEGEYPQHFERFHIVVTSPVGNWINVEDEYFFPRKGDIFFFNHRVTHSVGNVSHDESRIHLIVDATLKE